MEINVLSKEIINKIAAGEVVEKPFSVVKELVENSVDAAAASITVEINQGGIDYLRVSDNGTGIDRRFVKTAFLQHATSKIGNDSDLVTIGTLGFRGEALSSIAAVAKVELITKTNFDRTGIKLIIEGGEVKSETEIGCVDGTSVTIRDLFYNTPARRGFLKKPYVEAGYITEYMNRLALGNPNIAFKYINNESTVFHTLGKGLMAALLSIYGLDYVKNCIELDYSESAGSAVSGFIGKPELARGNRSYQAVYVNGRYVKNELIQNAAEQAYKTLLPIGRFPFFVINLSIPPQQVDVNVHPAKLEVRFSDEKDVFELIRTACMKCLGSQTLIPSIVGDNVNKNMILLNEVDTNKMCEPESVKSFVYDQKASQVSSIVRAAEDYNQDEDEPKKVSIRDIINAKLTNEKIKNSDRDNIDDEKNYESDNELSGMEAETAGEFENETINTNDLVNNYTIIGQLFNTYWIIEQDNVFFIIDQHAAHERLLYDELMDSYTNSDIHAQMLIEPLVISLRNNEKEILQDNLKLFEDFGFELEEFGDSYILRSLPILLSSVVSQNFFIDILDKIKEQKFALQNIYDMKIREVATIACKAAVKANDLLDALEAKSLIVRLMALKNPFTCPHGRPTVVKITKYELEKMFLRVM